MNNIQLEMNQVRQARKAIADIDKCLLEAQRPGATLVLRDRAVKRARYTLVCLEDMVDGFAKGKPRPWSWYVPMISEEFDPPVSAKT
ncbi:hypothetical protein HWB90_gp050 [Mycobacterium phage Fowlmouth]|uniref:Uncharacterized protein n=1 Tax=Mycobacterium phage Fowlmouth TaxID=2419978 RepID=A0A3G2KGB3_9CAUD|nr:hypothetical protein HWB90_gp050 [Mycobacterium phage Fowlmouth]AYN58000.1 hypothetical protein SEA_FOWLMOUTH_50 [Mycobacterium phage Fowlmouth]